MIERLMGKKLGMTQIFDDDGNIVVCTLIEIEPNIVSQVKKEEKEGYNAVQFAYGNKKKASKPIVGHCKKAGIAPSRKFFESDCVQGKEYELGQKIGVDIFEGIKYVDISGVSKGKGFQGVMKRFGFSGGPGSHGSGFGRHGGSIGMRSTPGICFKGKAMPGRMGGEKCTVQNLSVVSVQKEKNLLAVKGAVPGPKGGYVIVSQSIKRPS